MKVRARIPEKPTQRRGETIVYAEPMNGEAIHVPASAYTYEGFRDWTLSDHFPEQGRITYLDGRVYVDLTMEDLEAHNKVKSEVTWTIISINKEVDLGEFYCDGARFANPQGDVSNEPDAGFCLWETFESGKAVYVPKRSDAEQFMVIEGTPDWVVEIVSDSSVGKDKRDLRESYHLAGIPEYWLIDARGKAIDFQILIHEPPGYAPARRRDGWQWSVIFRRWFRLQRQRGRMERWNYKLHAKK